MLISATPITLAILSVFIPLFGALMLFAGCGLVVHMVLGILAVKVGIDALRGEPKEAAILIASAVVAFVGAFFLLGGFLAIIAGVLLLVAGLLLNYA